MKSSIVVLFAVAVAAAPGRAQITPTHADVPYAAQSQAQRLDVYVPPGPVPPGGFPVVIWIHGGGWSGGDKSSAAGRVAPLRARGIATVGINYRLSGEAVFPAQIHDCRGAIRFVRAHAAQFSLDPARVGVWGSSAGGHLSALVATSGNDPTLEGTVGGNLAFASTVAAAADYFGPTDILNIQLDVMNPPGSTINHDAPTSPESRLVGWSQPGQGIGDIRANQGNPAAPYPALVELCMRVNPITWADASDPPMLIAHGTDDTSVPLKQSTRLHEALASLGVAHQYRVVPGAGHGSLGAPTDAAVLDLFTLVLGGCFANCNADLTPSGLPRLDVSDFGCFQGKYVLGEPYADCNASGHLTVADFGCFQGKYVLGCP
ncbi:MAG: alpha/beta hydrolase fold domain-containing protein [Phycisphaerales bacterium]